MSIAILSGNRCTRARVSIPSWGVWWADVDLSGNVELDGHVELSIADATFHGTIVSGGSHNDRTSYRIAGGSGSWGKTVDARGYAADNGVARSTVAKDAADAVGEVLDAGQPEGKVGPAFVRERGPASWVLDAIAPRSWRVDEDGVTRFGSRPTRNVETDAARVRVGLRDGIIELAPESIANLLPGATVDGMTAVDVVHEVDAERGLRTMLYGLPLGVTRRVEALRSIVRSLLGEYRWKGVYEYRIVAQDGRRLTLQPARTTTGLPNLRRVRVRMGVPGVDADHRTGSLVLVSFVDGDPSRPVVVSFDDPESPGFLPPTLRLQAGTKLVLQDGAGRVLREGDTLSLSGVQPGPGSTGVIATVTNILPMLPSKVFA